MNTSSLLYSKLHKVGDKTGDSDSSCTTKRTPNTKHVNLIIGSAEALPILCVRYARWERERYREREREREIDGSDVIVVALKLAMSLHFPMPKIRTIAVSSHFPLPKIALFVSPFTLPVSALWRWNSHFPLPKNSPSFLWLSLEWREPRDEWSKTQDKWSNSAQSCCSWHRKNESN